MGNNRYLKNAKSLGVQEMAMTGEIHTGVIILRTSVKQKISAAGWRMLFDEKNSINFDGEIMVFSHMSDLNQQHILDSLRSYGFLGPKKMTGDAGEAFCREARSVENFDIVCEYYGREHDKLKYPSWLERTEVTFFDEKRPPLQAWKLKNSNVYNLIDFNGGGYIGRKGENCDWHPHIGKRGRDWH